MVYNLVIDLNPDDRQENNAEVDLKATNDTDAINEAKSILNSGNYKPFGTGDEPNDDLEIIGHVANGDKDVGTITVKFDSMSPKKTTVEMG